MRQVLKKITFVALIASAAGGVAIAQTDSPACNNALLYGNYGFTIEGDKLVSPPPNTAAPTGPQVGVAMTYFDGQGKLQQIDSVTVGGIQSPTSGNFNEASTKGTYSVSPNCTGTFTLNFTDGRPTVVTDFVIVDNGNEIDTVVIGILVPGPNGTPILQGGVLATRSVGKRRFTPFHRD